MGIDQGERQRQRKADKPQGKFHPFAAIEHRILDSASFQTLSFAGKAALLVVVRQLTRDNNGLLQMTAKYFARFGFAENTVHRTTAELIEHGLIFRTRLGGFQRGPALFAVTWLPITRRDGLYLNDYKPNAWRDFEPPEKKSRPQNLRSSSLKICGRSGATASNFAVEPPPPFEDYVSVPIYGAAAAPPPAPAPTTSTTATTMPAWMLDDLARLEADGLAVWNCYQVPTTSTVRIPDRLPAELWDEQLGEFRTPPAGASARHH